MPLLGAIAAGCHAGVPLLGAIAGCHCSVSLLACHVWVSLQEKIDQSVTPFSAAPFSNTQIGFQYLGSMLV